MTFFFNLDFKIYMPPYILTNIQEYVGFGYIAKPASAYPSENFDEKFNFKS